MVLKYVAIEKCIGLTIVYSHLIVLYNIYVFNFFILVIGEKNYYSTYGAKLKSVVSVAVVVLFAATY